MVRTSRKVFFTCILLLVFFLTVTPAFSLNEVKITPPSRSITINAGETNEVYINVKNNQDVGDTFSVSIFPSISFINHITATLDKYMATLDANSETSIKITFAAPNCTRGMDTTESFQLSAKSTSDSNINDTDIMVLIVKGKGPVCISDIIPSKYSFNPGETMAIEVSLKNVADTASFQYAMQTNIKKDDRIVERFDIDVISIPAGGSKKITQSYPFANYAAPGNYYIEVLLKDSLENILISSGMENPISLETVPNITHEKSVNYGLLLQTVIIKVKNEGNAPAITLVNEYFPTFMQSFIQPMQMETLTTNITYDKIRYRWVVGPLMPGEERIVSYQVNLWNAWALVFILIVVVIIAFKLVYGPVITKKLKFFGPLTREKVVSISLEVKNRSMHTIKDVIVRDVAPPIAGVVKRFGTLKPTVKRTKAGTELIWKFKSLRPGEERVLTYGVKPLVEIEGLLKLPKAKVTYVDRKKRRKATASKSIVIKSR